MNPVEQAARILGDRARRDQPLAPLTTYRVGGAAALFVTVSTLEDLGAVAAAREVSGLPALVLGRGSNVLVADRGYPGIVVSTAGYAESIELPDDAGPVVVGGGVALPVLARRTVAAGLTGFEWAVGVPGSIGGGVRMNAGGHGSDMARCVLDVDVVDLDITAPDRAAAVRRWTRSDLGFGFRSSNLRDRHVVVSARITLAAGDRDASERELAAIVKWRREHQPGGQNCGSVFVNPVPGEVTAGGLIDGLGLRGFRIGTAWVSDKHANFVQAAPGGSADDVRAVIEEVRRRVRDATGFDLRSEVRLVGFDDGDGQ